MNKYSVRLAINRDRLENVEKLDELTKDPDLPQDWILEVDVIAKNEMTAVARACRNSHIAKAVEYVDAVILLEENVKDEDNSGGREDYKRRPLRA